MRVTPHLGPPLLGLVLLASGCGDGQSSKPSGPFALPGSLTPPGEHLLAAPPFPHLAFTNPTDMFEADGHMFVAEQRGHVYRFEGDPAVKDKTRVLDLSAHTQDGDDGGLLSMVPHPEFSDPDSPHHGQLFVYYLHTEDPTPRDDLKPSTATYARLSRFTLEPPDMVADPDSELILIEQRDRHIWHQGSGMFFHPSDGFLYLAIGDEGNRNCQLENCQLLDKNLFGGVIRIDVDMRGGEVSHPIVRSPRDGVTDHYYIPNDNPFIDEPDALEEFYAIGLRNPHRMTFDPLDGFGWIGDVGQNSMEEVDVLRAGANYQWDLLEGTAQHDSSWNPAIVRPGIWTDPVLAFKRNEVRVLIGGHVYRGEALPSLYGRFVFASFTAGEIWAASYERTDAGPVVTDAERVLSVPFAWRDRGISSFGRGQDGRLYFLTLGNDDMGTVQEVLPRKGLDERVPARLSETGVFADLGSLEPDGSFVPYDVNVPLWSDGTDKHRWVSVPEGEAVGFSEDGGFSFPDGTVFLKHFEMALDERRPEERVRLETRILVLGEDGLYGLSYRWNEDETDAHLVTAHDSRNLTVTDGDGESHTFEYGFPSPNECLQCHDARGPRSLGFNARQLLGRTQGERALSALRERDQLEDAPDSEGLPALADSIGLPHLDDDTAPLSDRVRAYLDANCSHCHGARDASSARWDARFSTPLAEQGIVDGALYARRAGGDQRVIAPGAPDHSDMLQRVRSDDLAIRMPPIASARPDPEFVALLERWVESLAE